MPFAWSTSLASLAVLALIPSYIIAVVHISSVGEGKIIPSSGFARFKIAYTAVVMKPFKGEVVDGRVTTVTKMGLFAMVGPMQVFVSAHVSCTSFALLSPRRRDRRLTGWRMAHHG